MKRSNGFRFLAVMLCLLLPVTAFAAQEGSLKIVDIENPVCLYHVADAAGVPTEAFAGSPVEDLTDQASAVKNAAKLWDYALAQEIPGEERTPSADGEVKYEALQEGLYLVCSLAEEAEFKPFLVALPTVINGENIYHIEANPKAEEPEPTEPSQPSEPTEPSEPSEPTEEPTEPGPSEPTDPGPNIPQTGNSVLPKYLLLGIGTLAVLAGLVDLIRGREKKA